MSSSNCCFLTCIQASQEVGQVVWYSHLFQSFPQFIVMHTVKGFGIVNKAEIDVFLECSCFLNDPDVGNLISCSSALSQISLNNWELFLFWLCLLILSGVISSLISSSILGTYWPGEFIFQCPIFLPFHIVHGVLKAGILKWFAIPFCVFANR